MLLPRWLTVFTVSLWTAVSSNAVNGAAAPIVCLGDCDGSGQVDVAEIILLVNIASETQQITVCSVADTNGDGAIAIDEIIQAVNVALSGCEVLPTPTPNARVQFLCSAGPHDGEPCAGHDNCAPGGACVLVQGVCDGGEFDSYLCDCPGGKCQATGLCGGGAFDGEPCTNIAGEGACGANGMCVATPKICAGGDFQSFGCLRDRDCQDAACVSSGKFCDGGDFNGYACTVDADCTAGITGGRCATPVVQAPTDTPTPTITATSTPAPTPIAVAFVSKRLASAAQSPISVAIADLNGDAIPDVVTANASSDSVSILLGRAEHSFELAPSAPFPSGGGGPSSVAVADMNQDGRPDLVVAHAGSRTVTILLNQPDHTFALAPGAPLSAGRGADSLIASDLDANGLIDIATAGAYHDCLDEYCDDYTVHGTVTVFLEQSDHTFHPAIGSPYDVGTNCATSVAAADVNGDGLADLVTANGCNRDYPSSTVSILQQRPDHSYALTQTSPMRVAFATGPTSVGLADFDLDGRIDIATANYGTDEDLDSTVSLLLQQPDASFIPAPGSPFAVRAFGPQALAIADFDKDGRPDIATVNRASISLLLQQPNVTFASATGSPYESQAVSLAVADVNGDTLPDVVTACGYPPVAEVFVGQENHTLVQLAGSPFRIGISYPVDLEIADFNGDSIPDLATANDGSRDVSVFLGTGEATFVPASGSPFSVSRDSLSSITSADFDNDGRLDIAVASGWYGPAVVSLLLQQPDNSLVLGPEVALSMSIRAQVANLAAADLNGDGRADLIATSGDDERRLEVLLQNTDHSFSSLAGPFVMQNARSGSVAIADLNADGRLDIVVTNGQPGYSDNESGSLSVLFQRQDHSFEMSADSPLVIIEGYSSYHQTPNLVTVSDMNMDGLPDLITNETSSDIRILYAQPDHSFSIGRRLNAVWRHLSSISVGDLNGDQLPDLVFGTYDGTLSVAFQAHDGSFYPTDESGRVPVLNAELGAHVSTATTDLNADGLRDIIASGRTGILALFQVPR